MRSRKPASDRFALFQAVRPIPVLIQADFSLSPRVISSQIIFTRSSVTTGLRPRFRGSKLQLALLFASAKLGRPANNLIQELECLALFIGKQLGITDHVDEKNMRNFQMKIRFTLSGHKRRDAKVMHVIRFICHENS
jgi:hypothetical protein